MKRVGAISIVAVVFLGLAAIAVAQPSGYRIPPARVAGFLNNGSSPAPTAQGTPNPYNLSVSLQNLHPDPSGGPGTLYNYSQDGELYVTAPPYNMVGDGTTDNYASFLTLMNDACASALAGTSSTHSKPIVFPAGVYATSFPIEWPCEVNLQCETHDDQGLQACSIINKGYIGPVFSWFAIKTGGGYREGSQTGIDQGPSLVGSTGYSFKTDEGGGANGGGYYVDLRDHPIQINGLAAFSATLWYEETAWPADNAGSILTSFGILGSGGKLQGASNAFGIGDASDNGHINASLTLTGSGKASLYSIDTFAISTPHYVALTYDGSTVRLYVDGKEEATQAGSGTVVQNLAEQITVGPLIGDWPNGGFTAGAITGYIDAVELSNVAHYTTDCGTLPCTAFSVPTAEPTPDSHSLIIANFDNNPDDYTQVVNGNLPISVGYLPVRRGTEPNGDGEYPGGVGSIHDLDFSNQGSQGVFIWCNVQSQIDGLSCNGCDRVLQIAGCGNYEQSLNRISGQGTSMTGGRDSDIGIALETNQSYLNNSGLGDFQVELVDLSSPLNVNNLFIGPDIASDQYGIIATDTAILNLSNVSFDCEGGGAYITSILATGSSAVTVNGGLLEADGGPGVLGTVVQDGGPGVSLTNLRASNPNYSGTYPNNVLAPLVFVNSPPSTQIKSSGNTIISQMSFTNPEGLKYVTSQDTFGPDNRIGGGFYLHSLGAPAAPTANADTIGRATHTYYLVPCDLDGNCVPPSSSAGTTITNSASPENNTICAPNANLGQAAFFKVLRDGISGAVNIGRTSQGCFQDTGQTAEPIPQTITLRGISPWFTVGETTPAPLVITTASAMPSGLQVGDVVIAMMATYQSVSPPVAPTFTLTPPSGWNLVGEETAADSSGLGERVDVYSYVVPSLPVPSSFDWSYSPSPGGYVYAWWQSIAYYNVDNSTPVDFSTFATSGNSSSGTFQSTGQGTPNVVGDMLVAGAFHNTNLEGAIYLNIAGVPNLVQEGSPSGGGLQGDFWDLLLPPDSIAQTSVYVVSATDAGSMVTFVAGLKPQFLSNPYPRDNTADMGVDGAFMPNAAPAAIAGTTAGSVACSEPFGGRAFKEVMCSLAGYENTTGTAQTYSFPIPFANTPFAARDDSGGVTLAPGGVTFPASMGSAKTGWIDIRGN